MSNRVAFVTFVLLGLVPLCSGAEEPARVFTSQPPLDQGVSEDLDQSLVLPAEPG
jgi:hypothetical protein